MSRPHLHLPHFLGQKRRDVDMTEGSIVKHLIGFALPLLAGNIFQQMYNMVDTWVVGNFVSNEAFSAVGSVGPIVNILIGLFMGLSSGAGAVISQYYGAKKMDKVHDAVHTPMVLTIIMGVLLTIAGHLITPLMLDLMKTPEEVYPQSRAYLSIYFSGVMGLVVYNMGAGILRAVGDSQRPFYFLVVCAVVNTVLDLVFVLAFGMGVEGVALATVIAQAVSAVLVLITLLRTDSCVKLIPKDLKMDFAVFKKIFNIGIPAALQMAVTGFANVFTQSYINFFGPDVMSGWTAYAKIDQLLFLPMQSIALASTTFVGQNLGINKVERARKGVNSALWIAVLSTVTMMIPLLIFAPQFVAFFNSKPEVVDYGANFLYWITPFYVLCCYNQIISGALRGAGDTKTPMLIMLSGFVVFRQVYLYIMANFICNEVIPIGMSYPAGWLLCTVLSLIYYNKVDLGKKRLVED